MLYQQYGKNLCFRCSVNKCGGYYVRENDGKAHLKICQDCSEEIFGDKNTNYLDKDLDLEVEF